MKTMTIERIAALRANSKCSQCHGRGHVDPHCWRCDDSGDDHECPPSKMCGECGGTGSDLVKTEMLDQIEHLLAALVFANMTIEKAYVTYMQEINRNEAEEAFSTWRSSQFGDEGLRRERNERAYALTKHLLSELASGQDIPGAL